MRRLRVVLRAILCALILGIPSAASATTIEFEAIDLTNVTPGQDLWQYNYFVSNFTFQANQGFSIVFNRNLFSTLQDPPPFVNSDWNVIVL